jgi:hypothetical protein
LMTSFLFVFGVLGVLTPVLLLSENIDNPLHFDARQRTLIRNMFLASVGLVFVIMGLGLAGHP